MELQPGLMTSHQSYKKRRLGLSFGLGILTFCLSLGADILLAHYKVEKAQWQYSQQILQQFSADLNKLAVVGQALSPLLGQPCPQVEARLQQQGAISTTLRSIMLIDNQQLYCSSTLGTQQHDVSQRFPEVQHATPHLRLLSGSLDLGTRPLMALWLPQPGQTGKGIMLLFDLQQAIRFQLQLSHPYLSRAALQIEQQAIVGGTYKILSQEMLAETGVTSNGHVLSTPVKVHVYARPMRDIIWDNATSHIAVALLLALMVGTLTFSFSRKHFSVHNDLILAMQRNEFIIKYQPIIQSDNLHCVGAEVLVRWQTAKRIIPPDVFIPLVEELGLIVPFTRYVIAHVADELPKSAQLPKDFKISINVGSEHLNNEQLFADMLKFKHALPANLQLVVELTERTPIDIDEHAEQLQQLQRHAIKIALDDFGSGHSSLSYLKKLHPDYIKIDKTFTATIGTEAITATVLNMIIDLGQKLNIAVVAEGVETEEQANYLLQRGVQFLQGFYFARPISMAELQQWLNSKIIYPPAHVPRIMPIAKTADSANVRHKKAD